MIPYLSYHNISLLNSGEQFFWSDNFNIDFYIKLAKLGLISTSIPTDDMGDVLLPELQEAYAVLDFKNLHISRKVKKLLSKDICLKIEQDFNLFIPLLKKHHGDECWFTNRYIEMVHKLGEATIEKDNFRLNTILLFSGDKITAGEIGYFIGSTYTSLTGFFDRKFNNYGTLQLILLAKELEKRGFDFWNLGHPYMEYKINIGAEVLPRAEFLERWMISSLKPSPLQ